MSPAVKLGIGAVLCGLGLFFVLSGQKSLMAGAECDDCDEEIEAVKDQISEVEDD